MQLRYFIPMTAVAVLCASVAHAAQPAAVAEFPPPATRWLDTELLSIEIPTTWQQVDEPTLAVGRAEAERIAREIFPPAIAAGSPPQRVQWMTAFESADKSTQLHLLITEIPPPDGPGRPYIEGKVLGYADWQRSQDVIDEVRPSEVVELNGMPAVELTLEMPDGSTVYTVHLWTSVYRDRVGTVVARTEPGALAPVQQQLLQLLSTIKPSKQIAAAQNAGFRNWLHGKVWLYAGENPADALARRIMVVLVTFTLCFAISLRLIYEAILVWYRWRKLEDRALEAARRAARDVLRLGYFYSEKVTMACALVSMTITTAAVAWLAGTP